MFGRRTEGFEGVKSGNGGESVVKIAGALVSLGRGKERRESCGRRDMRRR